MRGKFAEYPYFEVDFIEMLILYWIQSHTFSLLDKQIENPPECCSLLPRSKLTTDSAVNATDTFHATLVAGFILLLQDYP